VFLWTVASVSQGGEGWGVQQYNPVATVTYSTSTSTWRMYTSAATISSVSTSTIGTSTTSSTRIATQINIVYVSADQSGGNIKANLVTKSGSPLNGKSVGVDWYAADGWHSTSTTTLAYSSGCNIEASLWGPDLAVVYLTFYGDSAYVGYQQAAYFSSWASQSGGSTGWTPPPGGEPRNWDPYQHSWLPLSFLSPSSLFLVNNIWFVFLGLAAILVGGGFAVTYWYRRGRHFSFRR